MHTVWVTRASGAEGAAAVAGAKVGVWRTNGDGTGAAERFASCVTSDDGSCTVETGGNNNNYPELSAFVDAGGCGGRVGAMSREPTAAVVLLHQPSLNPTLHLPAPTPSTPPAACARRRRRRVCIAAAAILVHGYVVAPWWRAGARSRTRAPRGHPARDRCAQLHQSMGRP